MLTDSEVQCPGFFLEVFSSMSVTDFHNVLRLQQVIALRFDREDHFSRPGFLHITICVFLGYKASNFVKKLDVTDVLKISKFEGFDRESRPIPFTQCSRIQTFLLFCRTNPYG